MYEDLRENVYKDIKIVNLINVKPMISFLFYLTFFRDGAQ